jgi:hypothetical protein
MKEYDGIVPRIFLLCIISHDKSGRGFFVIDRRHPFFLPVAKAFFHPKTDAPLDFVYFLSFFIIIANRTYF